MRTMSDVSMEWGDIRSPDRILGDQRRAHTRPEIKREWAATYPAAADIFDWAGLVPEGSPPAACISFSILSTWREKTYCAGRCCLSEISGAMGPVVRTPRNVVHMALKGLLSDACAAVG